MLESSWFVWVSQMNHIPMDIYYDKNLDWVSMQVKYFSFVRTVATQVQLPSLDKQVLCCNAIESKPDSNWEVKVSRTTGPSYGNRKVGERWQVHGQSKIKVRAQLSSVPVRCPLFAETYWSPAVKSEHHSGSLPPLFFADIALRRPRRTFWLCVHTPSQEHRASSECYHGLR